MKLGPRVLVLLMATGFAHFAAAADRPAQRSTAPRASLPVPAASAPLRILLVDDDFSENNGNPADSRISPSDRVFRKVISDAVGGDAKAWSVEAVKPYASGPDIERLRPFPVIVWYTAGIYGGNPDNTGVLSVEDEKTVRRYLQEVGGAVILMSPGYVSKVQGASGTWEKTDWPFLKEVVGLRGGIGLAQRFEAGTVTASDGRKFGVRKDGPVEAQFSLLNPAGARVLFTTVPNRAKPGSPPAPVATAHAYGRGRMIYVGFTFENLAEADLAPVFQALLASAGFAAKPTLSVSRPDTTSRRQAPVVSSPEAEPATVQVSGTPTTAVVTWTMQTQTVAHAAPGVARPASRTTSTPPPAAQAPAAKVERLVPNAAPVQLPLAPDASRAEDRGPLRPGVAVTYRVTLTDAQGRIGFREASFTPPAPRDPPSLSATVQGDGSVVLSWPEVPGVTQYQISGTGLGTPVVVTNATEWRGRGSAPGLQRWQVASSYDPGGVLTPPAGWPSAQTRVVPPAGRLFLTLPNGPGSTAATEEYSRTYCTDPFAELSACSAARFIRDATNWEQVWSERQEGPTQRQWASVAFADPLDLGVGRVVNCAPKKNGVTVCWASSHFARNSVPGAPNANFPNLAYRAGNYDDPRSLNIIVMSDTKAFFGTWKYDGPMTTEVAPTYFDGRMITSVPPWGQLDGDHIYAVRALLDTAAVLDSQGRKGVPHACLSCHGGTYNPVSREVTGASLLPLVPGRLHFDSRASAEERVRRINQIIVQSNPAPAIVDQVQAIYGGAVATPGKTANDAAIPAGWTQQAGLYRQVIGPYCASCHFAQRGPFSFRSWGNLLQNKEAVQRTVCRDFTMPHSEILFRKFWTEGGNVSLPALLSTALGFQTCAP